LALARLGADLAAAFFGLAAALALAGFDPDLGFAARSACRFAAAA